MLAGRIRLDHRAAFPSRLRQECEVTTKYGIITEVLELTDVYVIHSVNRHHRVPHSHPSSSTPSHALRPISALAPIPCLHVQCSSTFFHVLPRSSTFFQVTCVDWSFKALCHEADDATKYVIRIIRTLLVRCSNVLHAAVLKYAGLDGVYLMVHVTISQHWHP